MICKRLFFFVFLFISFNHMQAQKGIIPEPYTVLLQEGNFSFSPRTIVSFNAEVLADEVVVFNDFLIKYYGISLKTYSKVPPPNAVYLKLDKSLQGEAYQLEIKSTQILITGTETGIFRGLMTLFQLLPADFNGTANLPCLLIQDAPRFAWRGMHLDVCRHFFPKEDVMKYIDYLAMYKMNTFHWHLTDDQGWRIEIKKYPELTSIGGWRKGTLIGHASDETQKTDTARYGGFYTQDEVKEIVDYAAKRHITVVPEIEMPGHSLAAVTSYPWLSCKKASDGVATGWGVFENVFCTSDSVFTFLENVLDEITPLFPGEYIHIGGDECPKVNWKTCPVCQTRIKELNLKSEEELQSWFIQRVEKHINSKGKKIIGWDEILEGGLAPNAAVMSWRGMESGVEAAKQKHFVVMTPVSHCYFDYYQGNPAAEPLAIGGYTPLAKVYDFEPVPAELNAEEAKYILGAQANLWTEYIGDFSHVGYMLFPRLLALSEVLWSPAVQRDYVSFRSRLLTQFDRLDRFKINYARSIFEIKKTVVSDTIKRQLSVELSQEFQQGDIYYTLDGTTPSTTSMIYAKPFSVLSDCELKATVFDKDGKEKGKTSQTFSVSKSSGASIKLTYPPSPYYNYGSPYTLVDGILGRIPWNGKEWLGFSDNDFEAVIDLGKSETVSSVKVDVLKAEISWIYMPEHMTVSLSSDGKDFYVANDWSLQNDPEAGRTIGVVIKPSTARYVKVNLKKFGEIPTGKPGAGNGAWLFVGEIIVN
ncbi:MAG: beta-N-acetylhexosaminidase [Bacteroidetes bacterium HGW-Bacteroidetes-21]|nr:MAG: beta-N-acetylhexosaminidase [Bacteroidetes bacterium HGW-Bacteroidetes-21]